MGITLHLVQNIYGKKRIISDHEYRHICAWNRDSDTARLIETLGTYELPKGWKEVFRITFEGEFRADESNVEFATEDGREFYEVRVYDFAHPNECFEGFSLRNHKIYLNYSGESVELKQIKEET